MYKTVTAEEALKVVKSNDRVYIQAAAAVPQSLIKALTARHEELRNVEVCHLHTEGEAPYANPELRESFHVNSFFIGKNVRHTLKAGNGTYTPVFLSELPRLFQRRIINLDVVLIHVSVPDRHGYCSLGVAVEAILAAIDNAKTVIAQVNPQMPRTHGAGVIHITELDYFVESDEEIPTHHMAEPNAVETKIGNYVADLIEDRSTLQMGIGSIPNAVLKSLTSHKDLGLHTEMFSDGVIDLILNNVINGNYKKINRGRALSTFVMGSKRLYDYVDDNPFVEMRASNYTKAIIALPSVTKNGVSRIVPILKPGAGVVTTRAHVQYVVTEYGVANLYGKTIKQRVEALTRIAHPDHRLSIDKAYFEML